GAGDEVDAVLTPAAQDPELVDEEQREHEDRASQPVEPAPEVRDQRIGGLAGRARWRAVRGLVGTRHGSPSSWAIGRVRANKAAWRNQNAPPRKTRGGARRKTVGTDVAYRFRARREAFFEAATVDFFDAVVAVFLAGFLAAFLAAFLAGFLPDRLADLAGAAGFLEAFLAAGFLEAAAFFLEAFFLAPALLAPFLAAGFLAALLV